MKKIKYIWYALCLISIVMSLHLSHYYNALFMVLFVIICEIGDCYGRKLLSLTARLKTLDILDYINNKSIMNILYDKDANVYVITSNIIPGLVIEHKNKKQCIKDALENGLILIEENGISDDKR